MEVHTWFKYGEEILRVGKNVIVDAEIGTRKYPLEAKDNLKRSKLRKRKEVFLEWNSTMMTWAHVHIRVPVILGGAMFPITSRGIN